MGDDRPNTYEEDGKVIYRASSVGNCVKSLVASRLGYSPQDHPGWLMEKFDEGHVAEPIILDWITQQEEWRFLDPLEPSSYGGTAGTHIVPKPDDDQFLLEIPVGERALIRCHLDGMAVCTGVKPAGKTSYGWFGLKNGLGCVVEVKAFGQSYWDKYEKEGITGFPYYSNQVTIQMAGSGLPCMFVIALKGKDGKLMRDEDGGLVTRVEFFKETPVPMTSIKARIAKVEACVRRGELPDCDYNQYPCQFYFLHEEDEEKAAKEAVKQLTRQTLAGADATLLDSIGEKYLRGSGLEKSGRELKDAAKADWKTLVTKYGTGTGDEPAELILETGLYVVENTIRPMAESVRRAHVQVYPTVKSKAIEREKSEAAARARVE